MGPHVPAPLCILDTGEARSGDMCLTMQAQIQPHPVGSPLGAGDFSRISQGRSRTIGSY